MVSLTWSETQGPWLLLLWFRVTAADAKIPQGLPFWCLLQEDPGTDAPLGHPSYATASKIGNAVLKYIFFSLRLFILRSI